MSACYSVSIFSFLSVLVLGSCKNESEEGTIRIEHMVDSLCAGWQTGEGDKIKFRYPVNCVVTTNVEQDGGKIFNVVDSTRNSSDSTALLEIYEMKTNDQSFRDFKFESIRWLSKRFGNKVVVRNTEDIVFKGTAARRFEVDIPFFRDIYDQGILYAVDGISRYFLFFYIETRDDTTAKRILHSILLYK